MSDATALVKAYIKLRDAKAAKEKAMTAELDRLEAMMDAVSQELLKICKATGQDGGKTAAGSFTRRVSTRYWPSNWDAMYDLIKEHGAPELLEQRIHQTNFKQFLQDNPGTLPAGMNIDSKYAISVRRSTK